MEIALDKRYTLKDYLGWVDDVRRELIDGFIHLFPAPSNIHQGVCGNIHWELRPLNKKDDLRVYMAPLDVVLVKPADFQNMDATTVVQPDIFICKESQIRDGRCYGAPLFIAEVLSKSNRKKDLVDKLNVYQRYGVGEYWIVNPTTKTVEVFCHNGVDFDDSQEYTVEDKIKMKVVDFEVSVKDIFS